MENAADCWRSVVNSNCAFAAGMALRQTNERTQ